ncbi:GNAT family N-acetyltransferase [Peribacillus sp. SCS-37]|uniref:GNAT family N-acetyltransferase n=1 Tax=Paraperibacillus esterisolvens TaxID=3115296 RepID=UPI0039059C77
MKIEYLSQARVPDFIEFCKKHRDEVDDSFLYEEDLKNFQPHADNPTYIVTNNEADVIAVISLIMDSYMIRGKKGRFRIFHSAEPDLHIYKMMLESIKTHTTGINSVFLFIQEDKHAVRDLFESMQFDIERCAYFLTRDAIDSAPPVLPNDCQFKTFEFNKDEADYLHVRNTGFSALKGSETPLSAEEVVSMKEKEDYLEGGIFLLYHQEKPIGLVRSSRDVYQNEAVLSIGPLALIPEYQGQGLGRQLLRKALEFGKRSGYPKAVLSANVDNERAVRLYLKEGFKKEESVICYRYDLTQSIKFNCNGGK